MPRGNLTHQCNDSKKSFFRSSADLYKVGVWTQFISVSQRVLSVSQMVQGYGVRNAVCRWHSVVPVAGFTLRRRRCLWLIANCHQSPCVGRTGGGGLQVFYSGWCIVMHWLTWPARLSIVLSLSQPIVIYGDCSRAPVYQSFSQAGTRSRNQKNHSPVQSPEVAVGHANIHSQFWGYRVRAAIKMEMTYLR